MYNSLKEWITLPVTIHKCVTIGGDGDKVWGADVPTFCYAEQSVKQVVDTDGVAVTSNTQLYLNGDEDVKSDDDVTFDGDRYPIKTISAFYDGATGVKDIQVVYL